MQRNRVGKTRDLFKKIRDTKGKFHAKMGTSMSEGELKGKRLSRDERVPGVESVLEEPQLLLKESHPSVLSP